MKRYDLIESHDYDLMVNKVVSIYYEAKTEIDKLKAENKRYREALEWIKLWCEGSTCEICGEKEMTDTDAYDYVKKALAEPTS